MENFNKGQARTPEEWAILQKARILSSAELVNEGADVTAEGAIVDVDQEGISVKNAIFEKKSQDEKVRSRIEATYENILDQKPGKWRTVAETISLGKGSEGILIAPYEQPVNDIIIKQGEQINVFVENRDINKKEIRPGMVSIKVSYSEGGSHWFYISRSQLTGVQIKLDKVER